MALLYFVDTIIHYIRHKSKHFNPHFFKTTNQSLAKELIASYGGLKLYKCNNKILYDSNFMMNSKMDANKTNIINNTTWACPDIVNTLILPVRVLNTNNIHVCMGFWVVFTDALYFVPLIATSTATKLIGSNF